MERINYELDYYQWTQAMVEALRERDYSSIDWDNLIEEVEDMGKSQQRAIESLLMRLTEHLLKLKYWRATPRRPKAQGNAREESQKERNAKHWRSEVVNFRILLHKRLKESPSLKAKIAEIYTEIFPGCKRSVEQLFELPEQANLDLEKVLDENWFPNE